MLKEVVSWGNYALLDEIALVILAACFAAIVLWALLLRRETTDKFGSIPLTDEVVEPKPIPESKKHSQGRTTR
jgi:hypothetical protein